MLMAQLAKKRTTNSDTCDFEMFGHFSSLTLEQIDYNESIDESMIPIRRLRQPSKLKEVHQILLFDFCSSECNNDGLYDVINPNKLMDSDSNNCLPFCVMATLNECPLSEHDTDDNIKGYENLKNDYHHTILILINLQMNARALRMEKKQ